jgi:hypothetical protein
MFVGKVGIARVAPVGTVIPLAKVYGFNTRLPWPTIVNSNRRHTHAERMHTHRFFEDRVEFTHLYYSGLSPPFCFDEGFNLLTNGSDIFRMNS